MSNPYIDASGLANSLASSFPQTGINLQLIGALADNIGNRVIDRISRPISDVDSDVATNARSLVNIAN